MEQPDAASTVASMTDTEYQACGAAMWDGLTLIKALEKLALLSADFPLVGPMTIACGSKVALSLCKDRKEEQRVKRNDIIQHKR
jgi:hypothetical protein